MRRRSHLGLDLVLLDLVQARLVLLLVGVGHLQRVVEE